MGNLDDSEFDDTDEAFSWHATATSGLVDACAETSLAEDTEYWKYDILDPLGRLRKVSVRSVQ